ncbi:C80 family cysteine peptidase [Legionella tucsonensis]|uniref:Peptidase C80 family protein n=1 Tax=Legionella tucsonensis TaxID=40335 RepID=A0A0W0ZUC8_9GAMM|nr:C80 family cysteine peptidase [Legionella tucsonensis]KTD72773.1 Peptidase C80 family protein [Legionella tucsonensis]
MKFFSKNYVRTIVVEFYGDKTTQNDNAIKENAKNLLGTHFKEENRLIYSSRLNYFPGLSQLTSQSRLLLVGHGDLEKHIFSGCDVDMLVERLIEDCSLQTVKRITLVACHLGKTKAFIEELHLKLAKEGIYTEIAAYKSYLVVDSSGHRWIDLGEEDGLVEAGKQKIVLGWENAGSSSPKQVILVDTNETNPYYEDNQGDDEDAEIDAPFHFG